MKIFTFLIIVVCIAYACNRKADSLKAERLFTTIPTELSGIDFQNKILESEQLHYYKYQYIYIGGGVAAADFNNDGLEDLFFTSNIYPNKLFLNKGDLKFEDVTEKSGITKRIGFDTGIATADVNNDGFIDIYINRGGWYTGDEKLANMLYINNGDLTFTEKAKEYGIADTNRSISSTFFDYDKDGDLDLYICNAPADFSLSGALLDLDELANTEDKVREARSSDKLYKNLSGMGFEDVTKDAGIMPDLAFGLHAQVGDLNNDGWLDLYVSNDFIMPDFAYVNNGDGTFTDKKEELFKHIPYYSMGSDFADVNNDGLSDLFVVDMSPEDYVRSKTTMSMMSIDRFNQMTKNGYHYQYMHNMLQINNGNHTSFSEVANLSGVAKTDWSWATLLADFDLDGQNDIYVTNGVYRDVVHRDVNNKINEHIKSNRATLTEKDFYEFTQQLPQQKLTNYFFKNKGDLLFEDATNTWSTIGPTFSNGAVYVDLDNDGDLDVVTNNLDENATLLRNNASQINESNFLTIKLSGQTNNSFGAGATVNLFFESGKVQSRQLINNRGYMSSLSNSIHFGLGNENIIKTVEVVWSDGNRQTIKDVDANQQLQVTYEIGVQVDEVKSIESQPQLFEEAVFIASHFELEFDDFKRQLLLPHKLSQLGPAMASSDLNGDGIDDLFLGASRNQKASILLSNGTDYKNLEIKAFEADKAYEDIDAIFFDADNDNDQDLYVVSGSYEYDENSKFLQDRLYLNQGNMVFIKSNHLLPDFTVAGAVVKATDYDLDGDIDLFVGGRVIPGKYPYAPKSTLLINENGKFQDKTASLAPELEKIGMVTTAQWADIDNDGQVDLIVSGEWMGLEVFINSNGQLKKTETYQNLSNTTGWWNKIFVEDLDGDGDKDIVAGNLGLNYKFHASNERPFHVYTNDFDRNGSEDIMLAKPLNKELVPVRGKNCTAQQMPYLKDRVKTYQEFAQSNLQQILGETFETALHKQAVEFRSGFFKNENGKFEFVPFRNPLQKSPINSIVYADFDGDKIKDLVLAGNNFMSEVETTRADSGTGYFLKGEPSGNFSFIENQKSGFYASNDVRNMLLLKNRNEQSILIGNNNSKYQLFKTIE